MKAGAPMPRRAQSLQHQTRATKSHLNRRVTDATVPYVQIFRHKIYSTS